MRDVVEHRGEGSGLPVGIKSAVGERAFWEDLAEAMKDGERGVDFITIDGGEGGTGAAPLVFSDHVALPFNLGFTRVFSEFARRKIDQNIVFIGSGRLGFPERALLGFGFGCDMINVAREAMMAIGCIQAQRCHTNHCPTGVATNNPWLVRGLDPTLKADRLADYVPTLRKEHLPLCRGVGGAPRSTLQADRRARGRRAVGGRGRRRLRWEARGGWRWGRRGGRPGRRKGPGGSRGRVCGPRPLDHRR